MKKRLLASVLCAAMAGTLLAGLWFQGFFRRCVTGPCCGNRGKDRGGKNGGGKDRIRYDGSGDRGFHRDGADRADFYIC